MKVKTKPLKDALDNLSRIIKSRNTLPILSHVLLKSNGTQLSLSASNLDEHQIEHVECEGQIEPCCVSLAGLQWAIGGEQVEIERDKKLRVKHQFDSTDLPILDVEDFPPWPSEKVTKIGVACPDLAKSVRRVAWCAMPKNSGRYNLEAVHIFASADSLTCEASNGVIAARLETKLICAKFDCVLPEEITPNFALALDRDGSVLSVCEKYAQVEHANGTYLTKLLDFQFPNVNAVIPKETNQVGKLATEPTLEILSRFSFFAKEHPNFYSFKMDFDKQGCALLYKNSEIMSEGKVDGKFKEAVWRFNLGPFSTILTNCESEEVLISGTSNKELGPMVIQDGDLLIVAMPVLIT